MSFVDSPSGHADEAAGQTQQCNRPGNNLKNAKDSVFDRCRFCWKPSYSHVTLSALGNEKLKSWAKLFLGLEGVATEIFAKRCTISSPADWPRKKDGAGGHLFLYLNNGRGFGTTICENLGCDSQVAFVPIGFSDLICIPCFTTFQNWADHLRRQATELRARHLLEYNFKFGHNVAPYYSNPRVACVSSEPVSSSNNLDSPNRAGNIDEDGMLKIEAVYSYVEIKNCSVQLKKLDQDFINECSQGLMPLNHKEGPNTQADEPFQCPKCDLVASSSSGLKIHINSRHPELKNCPHCHQTFNWKRSLTLHLRDKECIRDKLVYFCPRCPHSFGDPLCLSEHIVSHHRVKFNVDDQFPCSKCKHVFLEKKQLIDHISQTHFTSCTQCSETFSNKYALMFHMAKTHPEQQFANSFESLASGGFCCIICSWHFDDKDDVNSHFLKYHADLKAILKHPENLIKSEEESAEEDNVAEKIVPDVEIERKKSSEEQSKTLIVAFEKRVAGSTGKLSDYYLLDGRHVCVHCCKKFKTIGQLTFHLQKNHPDILPFSCPQCKQGSFWPNFMKGHVAANLQLPEQERKCSVVKFEWETYTRCSQCDGMYRYCNYYRHLESRHFSVLSFKCAGCCKIFASPNQLKLHIPNCTKFSVLIQPKPSDPFVKRKTGKFFSCSKCPRKFLFKLWLKKHEEYHAADLPADFKCTVCPEKFSTSAALAAHLATHSKKNTPALQADKSKLLKRIFKPSCPQVMSLTKNSIKQVEKIFKCTFCTRKFTHAPAHAVHMKNCGLKSPLGPFGPVEKVAEKVAEDTVRLSKTMKLDGSDHFNLYVLDFLVCPYCQHVCRQFSAFMQHMEQSHFVKVPFNMNCVVCQVHLSSTGVLKDHLLQCCLQEKKLNFQVIFASEEIWQCRLCSIKVVGEREALDHMRKNHPQSLTEKCSQCGKGFLCSKHLKIHISLQHTSRTGVFQERALEENEKRPLFRCKDCFKSFSLEPDLTAHKFLFHKQSSVCDVCPQLTFHKVDDLISHLLAAHPEKVHHCDKCKKGYVNKFQHEWKCQPENYSNLNVSPLEAGGTENNRSNTTKAGQEN